LVEGIAAAFEAFQDRHGHFFRTRTRHNAAVARRYLCGLAQAEDCTFESMATVVEDGCAQVLAANMPWPWIMDRHRRPGPGQSHRPQRHFSF
jgi:hypothetical protein